MSNAFRKYTKRFLPYILLATFLLISLIFASGCNKEEPHTHNLVETPNFVLDKYKILRCTKCNQLVYDCVYEFSGNKITNVKYDLYDAVTIPDSIDIVDENGKVLYTITVDGIGEGAFRGQTKIKYVYLPKSVTYVDKQAFVDCTSLTGIQSENLTYIGERAFENCVNLSEITIFAQNHNIKGGAFAGCYKLKITVADDNNDYFAENNILYTKDKTRIVACGNAPSAISVPESVEEIAEYAFYKSKTIQTVEINGATNIGEFAFAECERLYKLTFSSISAPEINADFLRGSRLQKIILPDEADGLYAHRLNEYSSILSRLPIRVTFHDFDDYKVVDAFFGTKISLDTPLRIGYDFSGWYDSPDYSGKQYFSGDRLDSKENIDLYAKWEAKQSHIYLFDGNEKIDEKIVTYNQPIGRLPEIQKTGYTFVGWVDKDDILYTAEKIWTSRIDEVLQAKFTKNNYLLTYDFQVDNVEPKTEIVYYGNILRNLTAPAYRKGYTFLGWNTKPDGTGEYMNVPYLYNIAENTTLYAQYVQNTYKIMFVRDGGQGGSDGVTATIGEAMPQATAPTRTGYTFEGYFASDGKMYYNADMTSAKDCDEYTPSVLLAHWKANNYIVTIDLQDGSNPIYVNATYGQPLQLPDLPQKYGYDFCGLYFSPDGKEIAYTPSDEWYVANNATLYVQLIAKNYTIYFDKQGGINGTDGTRVIFGQGMPEISAPTRASYTFEGYFTEPNGKGTKYYNADLSSAQTWDKADDEAKNITFLYAYWKGNEHTLTFDNCNGDALFTTTVFTGQKLSSLGTLISEKPGYIFKGYYEGKNGNGKKYYDCDLTSTCNWEITSDLTLYAYWELI